MKTIKDAYEELKGDLNNTYFWDAATNDDKYLFFQEGRVGYICDNKKDTKMGAYQYICTVEEFNGYKPAKAITHEGKVYQIGAVYEFSDDGDTWELAVLHDYDTEENTVRGKFYSKTGGELEWCGKFEWFKYIRLQQAPVGTITEVPVELVDGECYQFDYPNKLVENKHKGFYSKQTHRFVFNGGFVAAGSCVNIKLLTVAK